MDGGVGSVPVNTGASEDREGRKRISLPTGPCGLLSELSPAHPHVERHRKVKPHCLPSHGDWMFELHHGLL